jgi:hypothetical protein
MHFHLAGALVDKLAQAWLDPDAEQEYNRDVDAAAVKATAKAARVAAGLDTPSDTGGVEVLVPDPRALGLTSKYASEEMTRSKKLVLLCLSRAIHLSTLLGDEIGIQNAAIHFWNLHVHAFRRGLYGHCMPEVRLSRPCTPICHCMTRCVCSPHCLSLCAAFCRSLISSSSRATA